MVWLALLIVILIVVAIVAVKLKVQGGTADQFPYRRAEALFTPAERSFLGVLEQAIEGNYRIFGKVRVADVVEAESISDRSARQRAFNRISAKHFDFVLCAKSDLSVICAIELNDQSHQQRNRQDRDSFLAGVCQAINLPLLVIPAQRAYSVAEIKATILAAVGQLSAPEVASTEQTIGPQSVATDQPATEHPSATPMCPRCGAPMVHRIAKAGASAGQGFWGCSTFPKCRGTILGSA